jgi:hypothetical protein
MILLSCRRRFRLVRGAAYKPMGNSIKFHLSGRAPRTGYKSRLAVQNHGCASRGGRTAIDVLVTVTLARQLDYGLRLYVAGRV